MFTLNMLVFGCMSWQGRSCMVAHYHAESIYTSVNDVVGIVPSLSPAFISNVLCLGIQGCSEYTDQGSAGLEGVAGAGLGWLQAGRHLHAFAVCLTFLFTDVQGAVGALFQELLGLAGWLVQAGGATALAAGSHVYTLLFSASQACKQSQHFRQVCK